MAGIFKRWKTMLSQAELQQALQQHGAGDIAAAEAGYRRLIDKGSQEPTVFCNLGAICVQTGDRQEGIRLLQQAIELDPELVDAHYNLGSACMAEGRLTEAIEAFSRTLALRPDHAAAFNNLGNVLMYEGRPANAVVAYRSAVEHQPDYPDAFNNLSVALTQLGQAADAVAAARTALEQRPDYPEAQYNLGIACMADDQPEAAIEAYEQALALKPDYPYLRGQLFHARRHLCDWSNFATDTRELVAAVDVGELVDRPFSFLSVTDSPSSHLKCARLFAQTEHPARPRFTHEAAYEHPRIRVAYLSADFHNHATAQLMAGVFEAHDRSAFEIVGLSFGPDDGSELRRRVCSAFEHFADVRDRGTDEIAALLRELEIDIAVDLKGYTEDSRPGILAQRPAPVQVSYLGYPGTMAASYIDYIIADSHLIPPESRDDYYEAVVEMPDSYQCNDSRRHISPDTPTRQALGLPEQGFVFCCFNNSYKITPELFAVWMRLLKGIDGSVLWLLESHPATRRNLLASAAAEGVAAERLVFAARLPLAEHLARHRVADLFLDTLPYNAHTTASDALWAGLPVLTCQGRAFAGRVASSLLSAAGLPELITTNIADYESRALELAAGGDELAQLRRRLAENRDSCALFDTQRFCRHLERAYTTMWERARAGEEPQDFRVDAV